MKGVYAILPVVFLVVGCAGKEPTHMAVNSPESASKQASQSPPAAPTEPAAEIADDVLANPVAKQLFVDAGESKTAELSVTSTRGSERIVIGGKKRFSNESPEEFAGAREALAALVKSGLLAKSRTIDDNSGGYASEATIYALTTKGHAAFKSIEK